MPPIRQLAFAPASPAPMKPKVLAMHLRSRTSLLTPLQQSALSGLTLAMSVRDPHTVAHQERVAQLARELATRLHLDARRVERLHLAGQIHDLGKLGIPTWVLDRPSRLQPSERMIVRSHAALGAQMLRRIGIPAAICDLVRHHHERIDGSGYPDGLADDDVDLEMRVLGVADVVDAMLSARPYGPPRTFEEVVEELEDGAGKRYDRIVVEAACEYLDEMVLSPDLEVVSLVNVVRG